MKELKHQLTLKNSDYVGLKDENVKLEDNNTCQSILISSLRDSMASLEERTIKIDTDHKMTTSTVEEYKIQNKCLQGSDIHKFICSRSDSNARPIDWQSRTMHTTK